MCRPEVAALPPEQVPLLEPEAIADGVPTAPAWRLPEDGDQAVVGGPFGFATWGYPGWNVTAHRFEDGRSASLVRFGCPLGALVAAERVVSVWCDPEPVDRPDPLSAWCSLEVHALPGLRLVSAADVPLTLELVAVGGDLLLFADLSTGGAGGRLVATSHDGVERWSARPVGRPASVCATGTVVVASQEVLGPDTPVRVETFDLGTGRPIGAGDVDGRVVGCNDAGIWVLDPVATADYGAVRAAHDGSLRVLDPETLQERARSGPALAGIRAATVDTSGVFVQEHTVGGRIALGWLASDDPVTGGVLAPIPLADLPLEDGGRSGAVPWSVVGHAEDGVWLGGLGVIPVLVAEG
jgi:hypothetical protein